VFAGLSEVIAFLNTYKFTEEHISFLRLQLRHAEDAFFDYLRSLDCSQVTVLAFKEGRYDCYTGYPRIEFRSRILQLRLKSRSDPCADHAVSFSHESR
jgi:nicotinic acid phosphoribosyltransferase